MATPRAASPACGPRARMSRVRGTSDVGAGRGLAAVVRKDGSRPLPPPPVQESTTAKLGWGGTTGAATRRDEGWELQMDGGVRITINSTAARRAWRQLRTLARPGAAPGLQCGPRAGGAGGGGQGRSTASMAAGLAAPPKYGHLLPDGHSDAGRRHHPRVVHTAGLPPLAVGRTPASPALAGGATRSPAAAAALGGEVASTRRLRAARRCRRRCRRTTRRWRGARGD